MVRTRIPEASLVGLLAALATFCALEARGEQPYSIVGQSGPATAATGRRPLAERIKAANRPIRIASEEELAPDEGLIPALRDPAAQVREWTPGPVVVEFPAGGPAAIAIDELAEMNEPGVMPPPESTPVAAHPTTADDAGLVGEVSTINSEDPTNATTLEKTAEESPSSAEASVTPPSRLPQASGQAERVAPPRRSAARVTPQRREALLDRLRTALAEVPRPLGLIPARPRSKTSARQHSPVPRSAVVRHPVPATSLPEPLTALSATSPTEASLEGDMVADEANAPGVDAPTTEPSLAAVAATAPEDGALPAAFDAGSDSVATVAEATDGLPPSTEPAAEEIAAVGMAEEPVATPASDAVADATVIDATAIDATVIDATVAGTAAAPQTTSTEAVAEAEAPAVRPAVQVQPHRQVHSQRPRALSAPRPAMTPLDRLQARLENMPRALGLVPAPRPAMQANRAPRRHAPQAVPTPADERLPAATQPPAAAEAADTVAVVDPVDPTAAPSTLSHDADLAREGSGDAGPDLIVTALPFDKALPTAVDDRDSLTATGDDGGATASPTSADSDGAGEVDVDSGLSADVPSLVATTAEETAMPAPAAEPTPVGAAAPAAPALQTPSRQPARRPSPPIVRRPIRDALQTTLANLPRPLGFFPHPDPVTPRRSVAGPSDGTTTPRALATKSIGTRPLDAERGTEPDVSRAIVAKPPTDAAADAADTTLTSGNDTAEPEPLSTPNHLLVADTDGILAADNAPATLADLADDGDATLAPATCIEVTMTGPEGSIPLGERVTLHLTVTNSGTTAATDVTPVVHFGVGLEPLGIRGRLGSFTADGSVMFERLAELPQGESVEVEIVAVCTIAGTIPYQGVAWCGDGEEYNVVPADASITVVRATVAAEPAPLRRR